MLRVTSVLFAGCVALAAVAIPATASAAGQAAVVPPAPATQAPQPAKEKKICRTEEVTGSIMPKRVCRTRAEWGLEASNDTKKPGYDQGTLDQRGLYTGAARSH